MGIFVTAKISIAKLHILQKYILQETSLQIYLNVLGFFHFSRLAFVKAYMTVFLLSLFWTDHGRGCPLSSWAAAKIVTITSNYLVVQHSTSLSVLVYGKPYTPSFLHIDGPRYILLRSPDTGLCCSITRLYNRCLWKILTNNSRALARSIEQFSLDSFTILLTYNCGYVCLSVCLHISNSKVRT